MFVGGEYQFVLMVMVLLKSYKSEHKQERNKTSNIKQEQGMQIEFWISLEEG